MKKLRLTSVVIMICILAATAGCSLIEKKAIYEEDNLALDDAQKIIVKADSTDIKIVQEDRDDVYIVFKTYKNGPGFETEDGDKIKISVIEKERYTISEQKYAPLITVYIPNDYVGELTIKADSSDVQIEDIILPYVNIDLESGDLAGNNLDIAQLEISTDSSEVSLDNVSTESTDIKGKSSDVKMTGFSGNLNGETKSGEIIISYSSFASMLNYTADSGDFKVTLNQNEENVELNFKGDEIRVFGAKAVKEKFNEVYGSGDYSVNITTNSGDIRID